MKTQRSLGRAQVWLRTIALLAAVSLFAAACGGSDPAESATNSDPVPTADSQTEESLSPTAVPEPTDSPEPTPAPETPDEAEDEDADEAETEVFDEITRFDERGPYAVGVTTLSLSDRDVEVWYPVDPADADGADTEIFDALSAFPEALQAIVPPELSGAYDTLAIRDAVAADAMFPVMIYGHGFGGYRQIATHFTTHLASWGFVVASTDHLERGIGEQTLDLVNLGEFDETNSRPDAAVADVSDTLDLLQATNEVGPLAGRMNFKHLAISGHSAGAWAAVQASAAEPDRIDGWISISGGTRDDLALTQPGMVIIGERDAVVPADRSYELFDTAGVPQLLINIEGAGHNSFTDACAGIRDLGGLGMLSALLGDEQVARAEDGCTAASLAPAIAQSVVNHAVVAWLRQLFGISDTSDALTQTAIESIGVLVDYRTVD